MLRFSSLKTHLLILGLLFFAFKSWCQTSKTEAKESKSFYYQHKLLHVPVNKDKFAVEFEQGANIQPLVAKFGLKCVYTPTHLQVKSQEPMAGLPWVFSGTFTGSEANREKVILELRSKAEVKSANFYVTDPASKVDQAYTRQLVIKFASSSHFESISSKLNSLGINKETLRPTLMPNTYTADVLKNKDVFEICRALEKASGVEFAEPNFIKFIKPFNDPFYPQQWGLNNIGAATYPGATADCDIDAPEAWAVTRGSANIKIAVLDEGVDLPHPDLAANIIGGFDASGLNSTGQCNAGDPHGTACAGIIAASDNNGIGVRGVAPVCKIMPVRIAYKSGGSWVTSDVWIGNSLTWSYQNGADVLSNSWGGGTPSNTITDAIRNATTLGRNGLGSLVIFASGNSNVSSAGYPGNTVEAISVAAMSMCEQRKSPNSCDGETFWGSNYGTGLDVAAPGVKIYTTDNVGSGGYNSTDYHPTFNGTSSACPFVAGVAALVLSTAPSLNQILARRLIEQSCDKAGNYSYGGNTNQPNGSWSNDLGYGRVNAFRAVNLAQTGLLAAFSSLNNIGLSAPHAVNFTSASLGATTYAWSFPGGNPDTSNLQNPAVTYNALGTYDVRLIISSASGIKDTAYISQFVRIQNRLLMQTGSASTCNTGFFDSGGSDGFYRDSENFTYTINPSEVGNKVRVSFSSFSTESCCDFLRIYNGPNTNSPLMGTYGGSNLPPTLTSTHSSGALTFNWTTDGSVIAEGWAANISCITPAPMAFAALRASTASTASVTVGSANSQILKVRVDMTGDNSPLQATQFSFATTGSTNPGLDLSSAQLYYTGGSNIFSTNTTFGSVVNNPNGSFSINSNAIMVTDSNFFWLVYNLSSNAVVGNVVDAVLTNANIGSAVRIPVNGNPTGNRQISNETNMFTGTISTCNANFFDSGGPTGSYLDIENYTLTVNPSNANSKVRVTFSQFSTEGCCDFLRIHNGPNSTFPLIGTYGGGILPPIATSTHSSGALTFVYTTDGSVTSTGWAATLSCVAAVPTSFSSLTASHSILLPVTSNSQNNVILKVRVNTTGDVNPLSATAFTFNTQGSTLPADIASARLYYTGASNTFSTTTAFGSLVNNPSGAFNFTGTATLPQDSSFFWLVYNLATNATTGNVVDAVLTNANIGGAVRTPVNGNPTGNRQISNATNMFTGTISTCNANFFDSGGPTGSYQDGENFTLTVNPSNANSKVRVTFSQFSTESCCDFLRIHNGPNSTFPLIGTYGGSILPPIATSTHSSGALTFVYTTDGSVTSTGWAATLSCVVLPPCNPPSIIPISVPLSRFCLLGPASYTMLATTDTPADSLVWFADSLRTIRLGRGTQHIVNIATPNLGSTIIHNKYYVYPYSGLGCIGSSSRFDAFVAPSFQVSSTIVGNILRGSGGLPAGYQYYMFRNGVKLDSNLTGEFLLTGSGVYKVGYGVYYCFGQSQEWVVTNLRSYLAEDQLTIDCYPNPNDGKFSIIVVNGLRNMLNARLEISDLFGRVVHSSALTLNPESNLFTIELKGAKPGVYQAKIEREGETRHFKFMVK